MILLRLFQLVIRHGLLFYHVIEQVRLREHKNDRDLSADDGVLDLSLPLADAVVRDLVVDGAADHEDIGAMVLSLPIDTQVFISTRIVDLDLYLTAFDVLGAPVHIQHGRLVLLRELIVEVIVNQARFSDRGVSYENHLDLLCSSFLGSRHLRR